MSIQANELRQRLEENPGREISHGLSFGAAFDDPSGLYPRSHYFNSTNINYAATGSRRNELNIPTSFPGVNVNYGVSDIQSEYPYNQVSETVSGHVMEFDDTPGNERVLIKHNTGSGVELRNDGSVIVSANNRKVEVVGGDNIVIVEGEGTLIYKGNLNLKVVGDFNVDVSGDYNVKVAGNRSETVTGSDRKTVNGNVGQIIRGGYSTTVTQQVTDTFLAGHSHNVKGTFSNNVDGSANYVASGNAVFTSEGQVSVSATDINIAADNLSVFGGTGVIGGEDVFVYGYNGEFQKSVYAESMSANTFHGDLNGTASGAQVAGGLGSPGALTNTALDTTSRAVPTASLVREYLSKAAGGIRRVKIDVGNYIKNFIDRSEAYSGLSSVPLNVERARSRMRDPANRNNSAFVGQLISEQVLCAGYNIPTPRGIGRIVSGDAVTEYGQTQIGNQVNAGTAYIPASISTTIIPEAEYNPFFAGNITSSTRLAPGITMAKFLGSSDPTNISFIQNNNARVQIAKYYYIHSQIIKRVQTDTDAFRNFNLIVSEGLYRPGPSETVTAGSLNDLRLKGRAVGYDLVDDTGASNRTALFDLAAYLKSKINYDEMILSYDTLDCNLNCRLFIILPELTDEWTGTYRQLVRTEYNGNVLAQGELVEALQEPSTGSVDASSQSYEFSGVNVESYSGQIQGNINRLHPKLLELLDVAATQTGLQPIVSSGFRGGGGSGRHNGYAADLSLNVDGRRLSVGLSSDRRLIQDFITAFVEAGRAQGIQPSVGVANHNFPRNRWYMGGEFFHLDIFGNPPISPAMSSNQSRYWGGSGSTGDVPAPRWLEALF